jgi:AMP-binding enzyme
VNSAVANYLVYDLQLWLLSMFAWRLTASVNSFRRTALGYGVTRRTILTMSSVEGSLDPPLSTSTLSEYFRSEILAKHHSRPALICPQELPRPHGGPLSQNHNASKYLAWDFAEFDRHIEALSRGLVSLGVKKGDRVGVVMGNTRCETVHFHVGYSSLRHPVSMLYSNGHA